jgi:plastocyanin
MVTALVVMTSGAGVGWMAGVWSPAVAAQGPRVTMIDAEPNAQQWRFDPPDITVKAGSTVVWHNGGKQTHTVTADDKSFDSGDRVPGADWQYTFSAPGRYAYHCTPHPWMKAIIHVVR